MRECGWLTTLVVYIRLFYILADAASSDSKFSQTKAWRRNEKHHTSPGDDTMGAYLETFFRSPMNQSVFRYKEVQKVLENNYVTKKKYETRSLIEELPNLIEIYDKILLYQNAEQEKKKQAVNKKHRNRVKTIKNQQMNANMGPQHHLNKYEKRMKSYDKKTSKTKMTKYKHKHHTKNSKTTFGVLNFWERDPNFDQKYLASTRGRRRAKTRSDISEKYMKYLQQKKSLRNLHNVKGSFRARDTRYNQNFMKTTRNVQSVNAMQISEKQLQRKSWGSNLYEGSYGYNNYLMRIEPERIKVSGPDKCSLSMYSSEDCHPNGLGRQVPSIMALAETKDESQKEVADNGQTPLADAAAAAQNSDKTEEDNTPVLEELNPYNILQQIQEKIVPELTKMNANVTIEVLGRTVEYKDIVIIKATESPKKVFRADEDKYDLSPPEKKIVFIVHALSVMGVKYLPCLNTVVGLTKLFSYYYEHLDKFDIYVVPMANPDGVAAWMRKFWNKNMSPQSECPGVALDRNFDVAWKESEGVISSCRQQYPGPEPFSELETKALREVFHKYSHRIIGYFHVHSSTYDSDIFKGDAVLYPRGFSDSTIDDDKYVDLKADIDDMMRNVSFEIYSFATETLYNWYGKVTGTSVDYASSVYGIPLSLELAMQLYNDDISEDDPEHRETAIVLTEVWHRVIDVIFNFMYKMQKNADNK